MFWEYLGRVMKHWWAISFGVLGSLPWWVRASLQPKWQSKIDEILKPAALSYLAIFCLLVSFFWANYLTWKNEKEHKESLENEIQEFHRPKFSLKINQSMSGDTTDGKSCGIYVNIYLKNGGMPSIAQGWLLKASSNEFEEIMVPPNYMSDGHEVKIQNKIIAVFNKNNRIEEKALIPIPKGGMVGGWLFFSFDGITSEMLDNSEKTLYVRDIYDKEYYVSFGKGRLLSMDKIEYFPASGELPFNSKKNN